MNRQRGVSLSGLLVGVVILGIVGLLAMKVVPSVLEYYKIVRAIKTIGSDASLKDGSVDDVRRAFLKQREVGYFTKVDAMDIEITKEDSDLVVSFAYEDRIPLFANVSLVLDYKASSLK